MKKHLIAAGVVAALAVPAMAQNVSVYGIIDMNYSTQDIDNATGESAMGSNALATSRIGFKGSEDLGGGLKADFMLETKLTPETGTYSNFTRESWIGFSGASWGAIRTGVSDVTDAVNIDSKVSQAGDLGLITELSTDRSRVIRYSTPVFSGFSAQVGYANPGASQSSDTGTITENTANQTASSSSFQNVYGAYENGPLGVYVGYESRKISQSYDQKQTTAGVKYDFGVISVGLVYSTRDGATIGAASGDYSGNAASTDKDYKQYALSAAMPLSNGYKAHLVYQKRDLGGADTTRVDFTQLTLAATKALSKRTSLYGAYINKDFDLATDNDLSQFTVGVVHAF